MQIHTIQMTNIAQTEPIFVNKIKTHRTCVEYLSYVLLVLNIKLTPAYKNKWIKNTRLKFGP